MSWFPKSGAIAPCQLILEPAQCINPKKIEQSGGTVDLTLLIDRAYEDDQTRLTAIP
jgi:hypothetical protein